ncbi:hypothetical protein TNCV_3336901 [Trichonephila clavipes]|nr:hypothetical protein TNCV_3336901 [Trichonephila clavipes]
MIFSFRTESASSSLSPIEDLDLSDLFDYFGRALSLVLSHRQAYEEAKIISHSFAYHSFKDNYLSRNTRGNKRKKNRVSTSQYSIGLICSRQEKYQLVSVSTHILHDKPREQESSVRSKLVATSQQEECSLKAAAQTLATLLAKSTEMGRWSKNKKMKETELISKAIPLFSNSEEKFLKLKQI